MATTILFMAGVGMSQDCPEAEFSDEKAAAHYPLDHKSNSTASDKYCVDRIFRALEFLTQLKDTNYIWFLVKRLDYERSSPVFDQETSEQEYQQ